MDKWIISLSQSLVEFVHKEMAAYRLYTVVPKLVDFIQQLTNWYVRMNRKRLKGNEGDKDWYDSLATLFHVLYTIIRTMAPFSPFLTEMMYQNLRQLIPKDQREESIHYLAIPQPDHSVVDLEIEQAVADMQIVIETGRTGRDRKGINLRQPVSEYVIVHTDERFINNVMKLQQYIKEELNCVDIKATTEVKSYIKLSAQAENGVLGPRIGKKLREIRIKIEQMSHDDVAEFVKKGSVEILGEKLVVGDIKVVTEFVGDKATYLDNGCDNGALVLLNYQLNDDLKTAGLIREVCARVQQLRKKAGLVVEDVVDVYFWGKDQVLSSKRNVMQEFLSNMTLFYGGEIKGQLIAEEPPVNDDGIKIALVKRA